MSDWLGLAFIMLLVVGVVVASAMLGREPKRISEEEFEKRVREGQRSQAAVFAMQQLLHPKAAQAVAVQQDLRHGYYNKKRVPGEGDDEDEVTADAAQVVDVAPTETDHGDSEGAEKRDA